MKKDILFLLFVSSLALILVSCGSKKSSPNNPPLPPPSTTQENCENCNSNEGNKEPQKEETNNSSEFSTEVIPEVETANPLSTSPVVTPFATELIKELRSQFYINSSDAATFNQLTRNLTAANTLRKVDLSFNSENSPELKITTHEGDFDFEFLETREDTKYQLPQYFLKSKKSFWNVFESEKPNFEAQISVRSRNHNFAIIELTRIESDTESKVYVVYVRKQGLAHYSAVSEPENLNPNSLNLLSDLKHTPMVEAKFYHVLTELQEQNISEANSISLKFGIYFYLRTQNFNTKSSSTELKKSPVYYDSKNSPSSSLMSSISDTLHNLSAINQAHIFSLEKAVYYPQNPIATLPLEEKTMALDFHFLNSSKAKNKLQIIDVEIHFE